MEDIKISVIIPHYNSVRYLKKLCATIPNCKDVEIIVIDDKSSIDTDEIRLFAEELSIRNGRLIYNTTEKKGPGICRNIGIDIAQGEWIIFADSDDYFTPNAFDFYFEKVNSEADVIYTYPSCVQIDTDEPGTRGDELKKNIKNYIKQPTKEHLFYILFCMNVPYLKMIKKRLIDDHSIKYGETMVAEDVMFSTKVGYYANSIEVYDDCTYCITESLGGTLSTIFNENELRTKADVFIEWYNFLSKDMMEKNCPKYYLAFPGAEYVKRAILERHGTLLIQIIKKYRKAGIRWWMIHPWKVIYMIKNRFNNG